MCECVTHIHDMNGVFFTIIVGNFGLSFFFFNPVIHMHFSNFIELYNIEPALEDLFMVNWFSANLLLSSASSSSC